MIKKVDNENLLVLDVGVAEPRPTAAPIVHWISFFPVRDVCFLPEPRDRLPHFCNSRIWIVRKSCVCCFKLYVFLHLCAVRMAPAYVPAPLRWAGLTSRRSYFTMSLCRTQFTRRIEPMKPQFTRRYVPHRPTPRLREKVREFWAVLRKFIFTANLICVFDYIIPIWKL